MALTMAPLAFSQQPAKPPPTRFPDAKAPPPRSNPNGPLEGQSRPVASPQSPTKPALPPVPGDAETFVTRNNSAHSAWVTVYQDGEAQGGACVPPGPGPTHWTILRSRGPVRVRAQTMQGKLCELPVLCETSLQRGAATPSLELRGEGRRCAWTRMETPVLRGGQVLAVTNYIPTPVWMTWYTSAGEGIVRTGCILNGLTYRFGEMPMFDRFLVKIEMVRSHNCSGVVDCTRSQHVDVQDGARLILRNNAQTCWVDADN